MRALLVLLVLAPLGAAASIGNCPAFPADNVWNARVDTLPVHASSATYINTIGATRGFHMDFGAGLYGGAPIGIPFVTVPGTQPEVPVTFDYADESDPGPYPVPANAPIEGVGPANASGDRHVLVVDTDHCILYEMYASYPQNSGASWHAGSGAVFDLRSNALRPRTWTSADAAGLPIFPGLARYDEVAAGAINHALRFTAPQTQNAFVWPARHAASSSSDPTRPPMGLRLRLKASVDITHYSPQARVIAQAMKTYGIILADNGSAWYVSGAPDDRWDNTVLHQLDALTGSNFEVVDTSSLMANADSAMVAGACSPGDTDGDGVPDCIELTEGLDPTHKDNDVGNDARLFAMQQYRDFLGREGDASGIAYWTGQVNTLGRDQVVEQYFDSAEFQGSVPAVVRLYFAYFLRIPDYGGLIYWATQARGGMTLDTISQAFAQSPEFVQMYGSLDDATFVDRLYQNVLGRAADATGRTYWTGQLTSHALTRGQLMLKFSESPENQALQAHPVYVVMMYVGMLRRSPDDTGFAFWVNYMDSGNSGLALIDGFVRSQEYHDRFMP
jgi:hypothetical protein